MDKEEFKFPDEKDTDIAVEIDKEPELIIEIEDDTPPKGS